VGLQFLNFFYIQSGTSPKTEISGGIHKLNSSRNEKKIKENFQKTQGQRMNDILG